MTATFGVQPVSRSRHWVLGAQLAAIGGAVFLVTALCYHRWALGGALPGGLGWLGSLVAWFATTIGFVPMVLGGFLALAWTSIWFFTGAIDRPGARATRVGLLVVCLAVLANLSSDGSVRDGALGGYLAPRLVQVVGFTFASLLTTVAALAALLLATDFFFYRYFEQLYAERVRRDRPAPAAASSPLAGGVEPEAVSVLDRFPGGAVVDDEHAVDDEWDDAAFAADDDEPVDDAVEDDEAVDDAELGYADEEDEEGDDEEGDDAEAEDDEVADETDLGYADEDDEEIDDEEAEDDEVADETELGYADEEDEEVADEEAEGDEDADGAELGYTDADDEEAEDDEGADDAELGYTDAEDEDVDDEEADDDEAIDDAELGYADADDEDAYEDADEEVDEDEEDVADDVDLSAADLDETDADDDEDVDEAELGYGDEEDEGEDEEDADELRAADVPPDEADDVDVAALGLAAHAADDAAADPADAPPRATGFLFDDDLVILGADPNDAIEQAVETEPTAEPEPENPVASASRDDAFDVDGHEEAAAESLDESVHDDAVRADFDESDDDDVDAELLDEAARLVIEHNRASATFLRRRLRVDPETSMQLLDLLRDEHVIDLDPGSAHGRVVLDLDGWERRTA